MNPGLDRWRSAANRRRLLLFGLAALQTWIATLYTLKILPEHGETLLEKGITALFVILFAWISLGFLTALAGFFSLMFGRGKYNVSSLLDDADSLTELPRTAIVAPICNEDVARVFAGLRATYQSVKEAGALKHFDFYILSDTSDPDHWVQEEQAWSQWCKEENDFERIHYRLRHTKIKRKTGNLADFCRRWGADYRYMIVFDADSFMAGDTLTSMVKIMEKRHEIGILQTSPLSVNKESLYARIQQFGNHVYGPLFTAGLNFWQKGDGYYWGHNAIIRMAPFMEYCSLERLPGPAPMGGEILSHDFVEAAYIRRAGWEVWLAHDLPGSYEEPPPTLLDELKRDRRWSQGNLQHLKLITGWGIRPTHRIMFLYGMMAYGSSLLWLALLALSTLEVAQRAKEEVSYFPDHYTLFPSWPEAWHPEWVISLTVATATLLFLPKILGIIYLSLKARKSRLYGGAGALSLSVFLESLLSALLAPVRMLFHSRYVVTTLRGHQVGWGTQQRDDSQTGWGEATIQHGPGTLLGLGWGVYIYTINPDYLLWVSPILLALISAIPVSVLSSRRSLGRWARKKKLFLIPAETQPEKLLLDLRSLESALDESLQQGFQAAVVHPGIHALHLSLLPERNHQPEKTRERLKKLREKALQSGPQNLEKSEKLALLRDRESLQWLHQQVWGSENPGVLKAWGLEPHASNGLKEDGVALKPMTTPDKEAS